MLHTFATTQSALMKKRVSRFMVGSACPACHEKRLKREALAVTFAGRDIGEISQMPLNHLAQVLQPAAEGKLRQEKDPATLGRAAARHDVARRVAAGGSARQGVEAQSSTAAEFAKWVKDDYTTRKDIIARTGVKAE